MTCLFCFCRRGGGNKGFRMLAANGLNAVGQSMRRQLVTSSQVEECLDQAGRKLDDESLRRCRPPWQDLAGIE